MSTSYSDSVARYNNYHLSIERRYMCTWTSNSIITAESLSSMWYRGPSTFTSDLLKTSYQLDRLPEQIALTSGLREATVRHEIGKLKAHVLQHFFSWSFIRDCDSSQLLALVHRNVTLACTKLGRSLFHMYVFYIGIDSNLYAKYCSSFWPHWYVCY